MNNNTLKDTAKFHSRKWLITKSILFWTDLVCIGILSYAGYLGSAAFVDLVPVVLLTMGGVNSVAAGAYNYANSKSKEYEP